MGESFQTEREQEGQPKQKPRCRKAQDMTANVSHPGFLQLGSICEKKEEPVAGKKIQTLAGLQETLRPFKRTRKNKWALKL